MLRLTPLLKTYISVSKKKEPHLSNVFVMMDLTVCRADRLNYMY